MTSHLTPASAVVAPIFTRALASAVLTAPRAMEAGRATVSALLWGGEWGEEPVVGEQQVVSKMEQGPRSEQEAAVAQG